jgi:dihydroneopterin aldolase
MGDRIHITGIRGFGHHGVFSEERRDGQEFVVDVEIVVPQGSGAADSLENTVDYGDIAVRVHSVITGEPVALIETLAQHIADSCLAVAGVESVTVVVHKPSAPIPVPFDDVTITITRP